MSIIFYDGFDGYDDINDLLNYGGWVTQTNCTISSTVRIGTGKSLYINHFDQRFICYQFATAQTDKTLYVGFAMRKISTPDSNREFFSLLKTASSHATQQISIGVNKDNKLIMLRGSTVIGTGTATLANSVWYYIEAKMLVHGSTGKFEIYLNGVAEISEFTGNTMGQSTTDVEGFCLGSASTNTNVAAMVDDLYICNSETSINNTYLGEQIIQILTPTSDSSVQWARNTGASNYSAVDDPVGAPDDATTYLYDSTTGHKDEFGLSDLSGSVGAVNAVKVITRAQKDDANAKSFKAGIKSGATNQQVSHFLGIGYTNFFDVFETSDGGSTAWTATTVNAALSTIEVI